MKYKYKTFHYRPEKSFFGNSDASRKTLEDRLNTYSEAGWEFIESIDCGYRSNFRTPEYIILLRREKK